MFYEIFFNSKSLRNDEIYRWNGREFIVKDGIPREIGVYTATQQKTGDAFGFKWDKRDTYESETVKNNNYRWLMSKYFDGNEALKRDLFGEAKGGYFLDAGCGVAFSSLLLFGDSLNEVHFLGIDISQSVEVAKARLAEAGIRGELIQADISNLPVREPFFNMIFSEGVLHHTDSTRESMRNVAALLRKGGLMLFYVYRKKGPVREFVDDYIREKIKDCSDEEAWNRLRPLTRLGQVLGDLNIEIEIGEDIDLLEIPKGSYNLQRFFYWHMAKLFYDPTYSLEEMNHINFDWYRPLNAHRQTPEEVSKWCAESGLTVVRMHVEEAGITVIARKN